MANGHGGYRKPENPAPVSGPGKYSKRTDGGPAQSMSSVPDQPYGQRTQDMNAQRIAPMAGTAPTPSVTPSGGGAPATQDVSAPAYQGGAFNAPSERPDEHVMTGSPIGPGGGPEVLNVQAPDAPDRPTGQMSALLQRVSATDTTGVLGKLLLAAQSRGA